MPDTPSIFFAPPAKSKERQARIRALVAASEDKLTEQQITAWAAEVVLPADGAWALIAPGKAASTTTFAMLYQMQFGHPVTAHLSESHDINSDRVMHDLISAGVFRRLIDLNGRPKVLDKTLRIATVRDPAARAISAFVYLCRTDALSSTWLLPQRLRLSAVTGFDWDTHPDSAEGFLRFLDYVAISRAEGGALMVNPHWRPQVDLIRPDFYRPDVVCRTENLAPAFAEIAQRLDRPLPEGAVPNLNRQPVTEIDHLLTPQTRKKIARVYGADFDTFGYDRP